jgi:hypothetical protein
MLLDAHSLVLSVDEKSQVQALDRTQEFICFLNRIEAAVPAGKRVHAILDNYARGAQSQTQTFRLDCRSPPHVRVVENDMNLAAGMGGDDAVHEVRELNATTAPVMGRP